MVLDFRARARTESEEKAILEVKEAFFVVTREVICRKMAPILDPVNFFWGFQTYKSL